jgi:sirohydrochlorin cobaltochelatase
MMSVKNSFLGVLFCLILSSWTFALAQAPSGGEPEPKAQAMPQKVVVVLAMHGEPPNDFPKDEFGRFFALHARLHYAEGADEDLHLRYAALDAKIRGWPRTAENDPFHAASQRMAEQLRETTGLEVEVGFNEFCGPTIEEAIEKAVARKAETIIVVTPMMTPGGIHAEIQIPATVKQARERHPGISIRYAWPFDPSEVAQFLAKRIHQESQESN